MNSEDRMTELEKDDLPIFDAAEYLATPEHIVEFLKAALETGEVAYIAQAISTAARAMKGIYG